MLGWIDDDECQGRIVHRLQPAEWPSIFRIEDNETLLGKPEHAIRHFDDLVVIYLQFSKTTCFNFQCHHSFSLLANSEVTLAKSFISQPVASLFCSCTFRNISSRNILQSFGASIPSLIWDPLISTTLILIWSPIAIDSPTFLVRTNIFAPSLAWTYFLLF